MKNKEYMFYTIEGYHVKVKAKNVIEGFVLAHKEILIIKNTKGIVNILNGYFNLPNKEGLFITGDIKGYIFDFVKEVKP